MDNLANLTYSVDTKPLQRVRTQLKGIAKDAQTATQQLGSVGGGGSATDRLARSSNTATDRLNKTAREARRTGNAVERQMGRVERTSTRALNRTSAAAGGIGSAIGSLRGVLGAFGLATLVQQTGQYGAAIAEVSTLVDTAAFDMEALSEEALRQSREFGSLPIQNVQAFYQAISAGATDVESASDAVEAANRLAVAGVSDVTTSVDALTTVMNSYNGNAGTFADISDTLFQTVRLGKTTLDELAPAIGRVANIANTSGLSFEEVSASLATLTAAGISTNEAVTGLRGIITSTLKPSKDAEEIAEGLGIQLGSAAFEADGLAGFLAKLSEATGGNVDTMAQLFPNVEALTPILNLAADNASSFSENMAAMENRLGATDTAFDKITQGSAFQFQRIMSSISSGVLGLTQTLDTSAAPVLAGFADLVSQVTENLGETISTIGDNAIVNRLFSDLGDTVQSLGSFLAPVIPYLDDFAIALVAIGATKVAIAALGGALALLTSPIALIAGGAVLLIANWERVVDTFRSLTEYLRTTPLIEIAGDIGRNVYDGFVNGIPSLIGFFGDWIGRGIDYVKELLGIQSPSTVFMEIGGFVVEGMANGIRGAVSLVTGALSFVVDALIGYITSPIDTIRNVGASIIDAYVSGVQFALSQVDRILGTDLLDVFFDISGAASAARVFISDLIGEMVASIRAGASRVVEAMRSVGADIIEGLKQGIGDRIESLKQTILDAADILPDFMKRRLDIQSPSRVFHAIGVDTIQGLIGGIDSQSSSALASIRNLIDPVVDAANSQASSGSGPFRGIIRGLNETYLQLQFGAEAARRYELSYTKMTEAEIDQVVAMESTVKGLEDYNKALETRQQNQDKLAGDLTALANQQKIQNALLNDGADAARLLELELNNGYSSALAGVVLETEKNIEATKQSIRAQDEFRSTLVDSIATADNLRDVFSNLGGFLENWIREQIATFAANKIIATVGLEGVNEARSLLGNLFGGGAASGAPQGGTAGSTGASAASGLFAKITPALVSGAIGAGVANALGGNEVAGGIGAAIGFAVAGPLGSAVGTALGGAFGGSRRQTGEGFNFGFSGGQVSGQSFDTFSRRRSFFRGTQRSDGNFRNLDSGIANNLQDFFTTLQDSVIDASENLGIESADQIFNSFEVATQRFAGKNAEEDLQEFLEDATRQAYRSAFDRLGPELQTLITSSVSLDSSTVEQIETAFNELGAITGALAPQMQALGLSLGRSFEVSAISAVGLTEALGGVQQAQSALALYQREVANESANDAVFERNRESVEQWNRSLGNTSGNLIDTRGELEQFVSALDLTDKRAQAVAAAAILQTEAIIAVEDAAKSQAIALNGVNDVFRGLALAEVSQSAANSLIELAGGLEEFQSQADSFVSNFFSQQEQEGLALRNALNDVIALNSELGLSGDNRVDTTGEARQLFNQLNQDIANGVAGATDRLAQLLAAGDSLAVIAQQTNGIDDAISRLNQINASGDSSLQSLPDNVISLGDVRNQVTVDQRNEEQLNQIREAITLLAASSDSGSEANQARLAALAAALERQTVQMKETQRTQDTNQRELANALSRSA